MSKIISSRLGRTGRHQAGAVLLVSLVFMLILTLIGLAGMQDTSLQEKMAGNLRDRNSAFQAAESALRGGEVLLASDQTRPPVDTQWCSLPNGASDGLYDNSQPSLSADCPTTKGWPSTDPTKNPVAVESKDFWDKNTDLLTLPTGAFDNLASKPAYVVEKLPVTSAPGSSLEIRANQGPRHYRITARGVGMSDNTVVVLQSVVRY